MKKITLLLVALTTGAAVFSQTEIVNRPDNNVNSIIAVQGNDGTGVFIGDQFTLTADTPIGALQIIGNSSNIADISPLLTGMNMFIYEDAGGVPAGDPTLPGTGVVELADIPLDNINVDVDGAGGANFTINSITEANGGTPVTLTAGSYWMVAFPSVASGPVDAGRWNWALSDATADSLPVLIDPADLFGAGATSWSVVETLIGQAAASFAWVLFDDEALSVSDSVIEGLSISPNPTNGIVNINLPSNLAIDAVNVYDIAGREVMNFNTDVRAIDLTNLSTGVYIAQLTTIEGSTQTVRIVKQ